MKDYSKAVDKIIATGKPVHEQLMAMLELVGGKFVDVSSNKHDKSVQDFRLSDCCGAKVLVTSAIPDEGTRYWKCSECGKPCNIMDQSGSQTKRKRKATTGSTVKAHLDWEKEFELWCDVTEVDRVSRESIKGFITTELLGKILEHNKDDMTGLYDFDGIALEVISLVKK